MDNATAAAILAGAGLLWSIIWSIISANRLNRIQAEVTRNSRLHDQSVQRLYRTRDALIAVHKCFLRTLQYVAIHKKADDNFLIAQAELSVNQAELHGLAVAIDDQGLLTLANTLTSYTPQLDDPHKSEVAIMSFAAKIHTRIDELLRETTGI